MILARAAYARDESDIYLLDNPTSALDQKVAHHIFKCVVLDSLQNKTVVLVTDSANVRALVNCTPNIIL